MTYAMNTLAAVECMRLLGVTADDVELMTHLQGMEDDLIGTPIEVFDALIEAGFLMDTSDTGGDHYWAATRDYVSDAVELAGLLDDDHEEFDNKAA